MKRHAEYKQDTEDIPTTTRKHLIKILRKSQQLRCWEKNGAVNNLNSHTINMK